MTSTVAKVFCCRSREHNALQDGVKLNRSRPSCWANHGRYARGVTRSCGVWWAATHRADAFVQYSSIVAAAERERAEPVTPPTAADGIGSGGGREQVAVIGSGGCGLELQSGREPSDQTLRRHRSDAICPREQATKIANNNFGARMLRQAYD